MHSNVHAFLLPVALIVEMAVNKNPATSRGRIFKMP